MTRARGLIFVRIFLPEQSVYAGHTGRARARPAACWNKAAMKRCRADWWGDLLVSIPWR